MMVEDKVEDETALVPLRVAQGALDSVKHNVAMMEKAVREVLEDGIDYGTVPGVKDLFLFDPGASKVRDFFDTYPEHHILSHTVDDGLITIMMEAKLIFRKTDQVVASGVGACSMKESRYRYRWVENPEDYGCNAADCRKRKDKYVTKYRVPNPDVEELVNTIIKIAAKRAEVDASQNLPGVSTAIAKLRKQGGGGERSRCDSFWGEVSSMGRERENAHMICRVKSMKEWEGQGRTLDEALKLIREWVAKEGTREEPPSVDQLFPPKPTEAPSYKDKEGDDVSKATDIQKDRLKKMLGITDDDNFTNAIRARLGDEALRIKDLSKTEAGDWITELQKDV